MLYQGKEISQLSNDELRDALHSIAEMDNFRVTKLSEKRKRHEKLFDAHPPTENPIFTQLILEVQKEIKDRTNA